MSMWKFFCAYQISIGIAVAILATVKIVGRVIGIY